ncbi:MAG: hypothetical protein RL238_2063 [Actinomycetota bacterium]
MVYRHDVLQQSTSLVTRADLAAALDDIAHADRNVARALTVCEAWEPGYVAALVQRAELLAQHDADNDAALRDRALSAIDRAIRTDNPFQRVTRSGVQPTDEAIDDILAILRQQARFHRSAGDLERRTIGRTPPA